MKEEYVVHVSSRHRFFSLNLREVWKYRDLILLFTKRTYKVAYKQTILGPLWFIINPIITSVFHCILFGNIAKIGTDGIPQLLFYMSSNAIWSFFSSCLGNNSSTFVGNAGLFGKVYFPRLVTPIANLCSSMIRFGIQMIPIIILMAYYITKGMISPHYELIILIPFLLLWIGLLGMGIGIIISSLTTKYRDLSVLVGFGISLWMYATPIVYPMTKVNGILRRIILLNPVTMPVEIYRYILLGVGTIELYSILVSITSSILLFLLGVMIFNKVERTFMDTV